MMEVLAHTKCAKMCKILSKLVGTLMFTAVMVSPPVYLQGRPCPEYQGEVLIGTLSGGDLVRTGQTDWSVTFSVPNVSLSGILALVLSRGHRFSRYTYGLVIRISPGPAIFSLYMYTCDMRPSLSIHLVLNVYHVYWFLILINIHNNQLCLIKLYSPTKSMCHIVWCYKLSVQLIVH
jgi:hypothetical protein